MGGLKLPRKEVKKTLKVRGCERKQRFKTEAEAQAVADDWNTHNSASAGHLLSPYRCVYHAHWHIGHPRA
jgi:hypothetical protein